MRLLLHDSFGRPLLNLRIAVTQRCNYQCTYCHREGEDAVNCVSNCAEMSVEEIVRIAKVAVDLGVTRVKLTGGEPLMRKDICQIVAGISSIFGLKDLSLTTNGSMLLGIAKDLYAAGLNRINISLATLNAQTYSRLTLGNNLDEVLAGIEVAVKAGFSPVKLNMVILKGINEQDIPNMIAYTEKLGAILQLIELDPINVSKAYYNQHHCDLKNQEDKLRQEAIIIKQRQFMHNRSIYELSNTTVEVVHPIENTDFCMHCTRLRLTSNGKLKQCLMQNDKLTDILTPIRQGISNKELEQLFIQANQQREPYNKPSDKSIYNLNSRKN
ncbi:MAG: GTP 3',8-cyclase MoaA [Candidatus Bathyarchaeota archaeon]|uniref:GTP 3',8-cyclase MoaA n=1 Tax=Candidatus Bathycorpusculum sp. TaxID=2994959 RepID=UPI00281E706A|nr:GTP 3',8-cyclase MoaA [Candidatus Termiticorpusculum sp.]MCL2291898.1 GTP 3',8-cyclase MoaA [Candidatus Termiticorpusculum sp.]